MLFVILGGPRVMSIFSENMHYIGRSLRISLFLSLFLSLLIFALCQGTRKTLRPVYTKNPNFHDMSVLLHSVIIMIYENYSRLVRIHFLHKAIEFDV